MRDSLVQPIGCPQQIFFPSCRIAPIGHGQKKIFGAAVEIEGDEVSGWRALNS
jgi:hypothetical protein